MTSNSIIVLEMKNNTPQSATYKKYSFTRFLYGIVLYERANNLRHGFPNASAPSSFVPTAEEAFQLKFD